jgi:hypothetical protein
MPWTVTYYSQYLTKDSALSGAQQSLSPIYQQYVRVVGLEVRVSTPLRPTQDETTKVFTSQGEANMGGSIIPNDGDMFTAEIAPGVIGVFKITSNTKKTNLGRGSFTVAYSLQSDSETLHADLKTKTIRTIYYSKESLIDSGVALLDSDGYIQRINIHKFFDTLLNAYLQRFLNRSYGVLQVPDQDAPTYDYWLSNFVLSQLEQTDHPFVATIKRLTSTDSFIMQEKTVWDALVSKDSNLLYSCFKRAGVVSTSIVNHGITTSFLYTIRYSGMKQSVYPKDPVEGVNEADASAYLTSVIDFKPSVMETGKSNTIPNTINTLPDQQQITVPLPPVTQDDYYVFSENFYVTKTNLSVLEAIVLNYLDGNKIDREQLISTVHSFMSWGRVEQFYYGAVLLFLMKQCIRGDA